MNLFATVLTYPAPSANYRGESELSRTVIQKITDGRHEYPIISPEAMRNALREILRKYGLPMNRERVHPTAGEGDEKQQLAVRYEKYPDPATYADDFLFGYLLAVKEGQLKKLRTEKGRGYPLKRDSILRMNLAKGLEPYRHDTVFTQSPKFAEGNPWTPGDGSAANSSLLHRETAVTAFQYPFALSGEDCKPQAAWARALLKAVGELSDVAGNHARSYYEMAPASVTVRLTDQLVAGHETYHFRLDGRGPNNERRLKSSLLDDLLDDDLNLPGGEFFVGGEVVRTMAAEARQKLAGKGVTLDADPRRLLATVADRFLGPPKEA